MLVKDLKDVVSAMPDNMEILMSAEEGDDYNELYDTYLSRWDGERPVHPDHYDKEEDLPFVLILW